MARNILVVEDDNNISDLIRMYLEKALRSALHRTAARQSRSSATARLILCCLT